MLRFNAASFLAVFSNLKHHQGEIPPSSSRSPQEWQELAERIKHDLARVEEHCRRLPVSSNLVRQIARTAQQLSLGDDDAPNLVSYTAINDIVYGLCHDLSEHRFYVVSSDLAHLMTDVPLFGKGVADKFPDAAKDIAASGRCLALDEWTACVFHSMRVLEHGLRAFAGYLSIPMVDVEQWKVVIDQIEKAIRVLEGMPKGAPKTEKVQFCSEAALQFRYFKDAWRNHVSHSRASYDSREADSIWNHTKEFMEHLAENL